MGVAYFIGPFDPVLWKSRDPVPVPTTDFRINPEIYSNQLLVRWPGAKSYSGKVGSWTLDEPGTYILLHDHLLHVSFSPGANFTDFILWHRQFILSQYPLFLFTDASWDSLKLFANTTRQEIQAFTGIINIINL